ncbi:MAG TPA: adenylyl-sulfate kinase [Terriglobales bacterium]|nr:adenylyl-sulfate kinase [Terriglobales bacterium]
MTHTTSTAQAVSATDTAANQPAANSNEDKARFPFAIVGHVDHGKSTLIGRLLHDTGSLPEGKLAELKAASDKRGGTLEWSFLLDAFQAERDQGITIDTTQIFFGTDKRRYVIIDAPGHKEFLKNAISGVAQAQAAFLVIDAAEGVREQSRRHALILHILGLRQVAVLINKIDLIDHDAARYAAVAEEIKAYLGQLGVTPLALVPISARNGDNIASRSDKTPWYDGPTVVDVLDNFEPAPAPVDQKLRLPVQDVFKFDHRRIVAGRIESGRLRVGDQLVFSPSGKQARIASLETWSAAPQIAAAAGQSIAITLDDELFIQRGDIASHQGEQPHLTHQATMRLFWLDTDVLRAGDRLKLKVATAEYPVTVERIHAVIDVANLANTQSDKIEQNAVAEVTLRSPALMALDRLDEASKTGRGVLLRDGDIVGGAIVLHAGAVDASRNLYSPTNTIGSAIRASANGHNGAVLWLTGLSGSGKSTLATAAEHRLFQRGRQVVVLDGDTLRQGLNSDLGFSPEARAENIRRTAEVAKLLAETGLIVFVSLISPWRADRDKARRIIGDNFAEIYVQADIETCKARDPKGLYKKALKGEIKNFTGIDQPYEAPEKPELVIDTAQLTEEQALQRLLDTVDDLTALTGSENRSPTDSYTI